MQHLALRRSVLWFSSLSSLAALVAVACSSGGDEGVAARDAGADAKADVSVGLDAQADVAVVEPPPAAEDLERDVLATDLALDVSTLKGTAKIQVAPSAQTGISFEIGDLDVTSVRLGVTPLNFKIVSTSALDAGTKTQRIDIGVPVSVSPTEITIEYGFKAHKNFDGWMSSSNLTFLWPYFCSNLFPCHSKPADGSTFKMNVTGVPSGMTAIYPKSIPFDAPTYMPAIAVGKFDYVELGTTTKGTHVGYYTLPADADAGIGTGTANLKGIFEWFENTLGAYKFGDHVASVDANWGPGMYGGMEHHPFWHVASGTALGAEYIHAHEASHGWFGDGVRLKCWEDFVLSEGTATYLAARAIEAVRGKTEGDVLWGKYAGALTSAINSGDTVAWPQTCNKIDILTDPLWSNIPYFKGAFFYRKVALAIGASKLDAILAKFYATYAGKAASMGDMISMIQSESGFDPTNLVNAWLKGKGNPGT